MELFYCRNILPHCRKAFSKRRKIPFPPLFRINAITSIWIADCFPVQQQAVGLTRSARQFWFLMFAVLPSSFLPSTRSSRRDLTYFTSRRALRDDCVDRPFTWEHFPPNGWSTAFMDTRTRADIIYFYSHLMIMCSSLFGMASLIFRSLPRHRCLLCIGKIIFLSLTAVLPARLLPSWK